MDKKALGMAIFMGLYVPLFTGISVAIHRFMQATPQQSNKIIIVYRQFENQSFDDAYKTSFFKPDKSPDFPFSKDIWEFKKLKLYKFLPLTYKRNENLLQNFELNNIVIVEPKVNLQQLSQKNHR